MILVHKWLWLRRKATASFRCQRSEARRTSLLSSHTRSSERLTVTTHETTTYKSIAIMSNANEYVRSKPLPLSQCVSINSSLTTLTVNPSSQKPPTHSSLSPPSTSPLSSQWILGMRLGVRHIALQVPILSTAQRILHPHRTAIRAACMAGELEDLVEMVVVRDGLEDSRVRWTVGHH
jgi:hypothetical protein